jgi:hypothetical protein
MFQEVMHQMISVAAGPQLCDSEAVYLVSSIDVQQAGVTLIKKENVDATEQKLHVAADDEGMRFIYMCVRACMCTCVCALK